MNMKKEDTDSCSLSADILLASEMPVLFLLGDCRWLYATSAPDPIPATSTVKGCFSADSSCTSVTLL